MEPKPEVPSPAAPRPPAGREGAPAMDEAWERFVGFLRETGARITQSRRMVLEAALGREDHFRADDLAAVLATGARRVSRGTVYRTLALMVQAGLLRQIRDTDTHAHYEPIFGAEQHEHMICDRCGRFVEFEDREMDALVRKACRRMGFTPRTHRVAIFGLCRQCLEAG